MKVCIAEKPSVAAEIAKVLGAKFKRDGYFEGNGYQVTWTFGHLCQLSQPHHYNEDWKKWKMDYLPMIPDHYDVELIDDKGVKKQFKVIKELYKKATLIINCGDAGQEGELIQRWVMGLCKFKCPVKRLWISSLTEESIRKGFEDLKPQSDYDSLYDAGLARAHGDWLLGMNATRFYTIKYGGYNQMLSIGRVQTPTLSMIVSRDMEIENFVPKPYYVLTTKYKGVVFNSINGKYNNQANAEADCRKITGQPFVVTKITETKGSEQAPQLYDLTSLQVDCNKKYGMSADLTLKTIQSLYEKKLTTYPRVDTKYLSDDIYPKCEGILRNLKAYSNITIPILSSPLLKSPKVFNSKKVTDHHAIIPTGVEPTKLSENETKVYDLVVRRFVAVFYPSCLFNTTTVSGRSVDIDFKATGKTVTDWGWKKVYKNNKLADEKEEEEITLPTFSALEKGSHIPSVEHKETTPPKRFTEATLLQAMETAGKFVEDESLREAMKENGIGRPSSRAGIIETLIKRGYVERQKKNIVSTSTGRQLLSYIKSNLLKSPELTGRWEKKLRDIESRKYSRKSFMEELESQLREIISNG